jgi:hypothetical protein
MATRLEHKLDRPAAGRRARIEIPGAELTVEQLAGRELRLAEAGGRPHARGGSGLMASLLPLS